MISYEEMNDIKKIIKHFEESDFWVKTINNEANEQKGGYLGMLLVNLGASLLGNLLTSKGRIRGGKSIIRELEVPLHPFTNTEIPNYYQDEPKFNGVYYRNNLPKIMDRHM